MVGGNRQLGTNEPTEFEKQPVEVQDNMKDTDHFRGNDRIYPNLIKEKIGGCQHVTGWTCKTTRISPVVMPKYVPDHWTYVFT